MRTKTLGILGLTGAPCLYLGLQVEEIYPQLADTWFTGVWGLLYITGWICIILAFRRLRLTGDGFTGRLLLNTVLGSLLLADISNVLQLILQHSKPAWFFAFDLFWPISNLLMIGVGIAVIRAGVVKGFLKWIPLTAGMWLPLAMLSLRFPPQLSFLFGGLYSAAVWMLLALIVLTSTATANQTNRNPTTSQAKLAA